MTSISNSGICPVQETINLIGKKWSLIVIHTLTEGPKRFNELRRAVNGVSSKTLALTLSDLEKKGIVVRKVHMRSPIRIEYSLAEKGEDLKKVMEAMRLWGEKWSQVKV